MLRKATQQDGEAIAAIYNHYVANTVITFEELPVSGEEMARRIGEVEDAALPWLVSEQDGRVVGYAYATRWKSRSAYRFTVEISVYLAHDQGHKGLGTQLYAELFEQLKQKGIHAVIGGIALPNPASVALHEKFGMKQVASFKELGFKFGHWIDVGYWQVTLS